MRFRLLFISFMYIGLAYGQDQFQQDESGLLPVMYSGSVIVSGDINNDGLDDLVALDEGTRVKVFYQKGKGKGFLYDSLGDHRGEPKWSIAVGDIDSDGNKDIFSMGAYEHIQWLSLTPNGVIKKTIPAPELYAQGANLVDVNNDGVLELFICNDIGLNYLYQLDTAGIVLQRVEDWVDFRTVPASDNSGNYGSLWMDIDKNGLPDLYIAKCRAGVDDPTDPRRINVLYMQESPLIFKEAALEFGLADGSQSWTADFADVDNDGDWDCFIANHKGNSLLMIQESDGRFVDRSEEWGLSIKSNILQVKFVDINNDGLQDLIYSGEAKALFWNLGDHFVKAQEFIGQSPMTSFVVGDWNDDGWLDIYATYCDPFNLPSDRKDRLWWNKGGDGHFVRLKLQGTISNLDGIGARAEVFSSRGVQMKELRAGESYGIQNSNILHFGIADGDRPDSILVYWPSGVVDRILDPVLDTRYHVTEGQCTYVPPTIRLTNSGYFCGGDSIQLSAPEADSYSWSNGQTTQSIIVDQEGRYFVVLEKSGCSQLSYPVYIQDDPDTDPVIRSTSERYACDGDIVTLSTVAALGYKWNTGDTTQAISINSSGSFQVSITGFCRDTVSGVVEMTFYDRPDQPEVSADTVIIGQKAVLKATGDKVLWYDTPDASTPIHIGNSLIIDSLLADTTFYAASVKDYSGRILYGGEKEFNGSQQAAPFFNSGLYFTVHRRCRLRSVKVYAQKEGDRMIEVMNAKGDVIAASRVFLEEGWNQVMLGVELMPSPNRYLITTNAEVNREVFGNANPLLNFREDFVEYPYRIDDDISIIRSVHGTSYYFYFFDWEVEEIDYCESDRVPVRASLLTASPKYFYADKEIVLYPSPSHGELNIERKGEFAHEEVELSLYNLNGQLVFSKPGLSGSGTIKLQVPMPPGIYLVHVLGETFYTTRKWIKID